MKYEYDIIDRLESMYNAKDDKEFLNILGESGWRVVGAVRIPVSGQKELYYNRYIIERKIK